MPAPVLPETAPFTAEQRGWLNGYLAGLFAGGDLSAARGGAPAAPAAPTRALRVLYASQSGNADAAAHALADRLRGADAGEGHVWAPAVLAMDAHATVDWGAETHLVLTSSTWGDGDMPDNGKAFWEWLSGEAGAALAHLRYAVLGLGDRNYARFCAAGRKLDERLAALGAERLVEPEFLDVDWEGPAAAWRERVATALGAGSPAETAGTGPAPRAEAGWSKTNPFPAPLVENRRLNGQNSVKDTRHIAFSLAGSGLQYRSGDALGVWPVNHYELVDSLVIACNASGGEVVRTSDGQEMSFRAALLSRLDLARPSRELLAALAASRPGRGDADRLAALLDETEEGEREAFLRERDVLDVLHAFTTARLEPQSLVDHLRKLSPRLYSISSSPLAHPGEVHLTVGVQKILRSGRERLGAASTFLASRIPLGLPANVFVQPSGHFHPPEDPSRDLVMVGPGTGIAPFRGFLHDREASGATGRNWLFFGDQHEASDFLYRDEILAFRGRGTLAELDLAFSRDQETKVYVQDRMVERAPELWRWLEGGAHFCVCGDAKRMAKDVDAALRRVVEIGGGRTPEEAEAYVAAMAADKRYLRDVY